MSTNNSNNHIPNSPTPQLPAGYTMQRRASIPPPLPALPAHLRVSAPVIPAIPATTNATKATSPITGSNQIPESNSATTATSLVIPSLSVSSPSLPPPPVPSNFSPTARGSISTSILTSSPATTSRIPPPLPSTPRPSISRELPLPLSPSSNPTMFNSYLRQHGLVVEKSLQQQLQQVQQQQQQPNQQPLSPNSATSESTSSTSTPSRSAATSSSATSSVSSSSTMPPPLPIANRRGSVATNPHSHLQSNPAPSPTRYSVISAPLGISASNASLSHDVFTMPITVSSLLSAANNQQGDLSPAIKVTDATSASSSTSTSTNPSALNGVNHAISISTNLSNGSNPEESCKSTTSLGPNAFATHLNHKSEAVASQTEHGMKTMKRLRNFIASYATLQEKFASDLEKLASTEYNKLLGNREFDRMPGMSNALLNFFGKIFASSHAHSTLASDVNMQCIDPLDRFHNIGVGMCRESAEAAKRVNMAIEKTTVQVAKDRESCRQALVALSSRKGKSEQQVANGHHDSSVLALIGKRSTPSSVDLARKKAWKACEQYEKIIESSNEAYLKQFQQDLPAVMTQMQSLEEMRLQSMAAALQSFVNLQQTFASTQTSLVSELRSVSSYISIDDDIRSYISTCIHEYGPPLPPQPFTYDMAITAAELKADIDATANVAASSNSSSAAAPSTTLSLSASSSALFYNTLEGVMQHELSLFSRESDTSSLYQRVCELDVPLILPTLISAIMSKGGLDSEGIFRLSCSSDELHAVRRSMERGDYSLANIDSPHVPAALLKAWLRDLAEPLVPFASYGRCIEYGKQFSALAQSPPTNPISASELHDIVRSFPLLNRRVMFHILHFLQELLQPDHIEHTRMNLHNVTIVFAPSFLRNPTNDPIQMLNDTKHAGSFLHSLIGTFLAGEGWEEEREWSTQLSSGIGQDSIFSKTKSPPPFPPASGSKQALPPPLPLGYQSSAPPPLITISQSPPPLLNGSPTNQIPFSAGLPSHPPPLPSRANSHPTHISHNSH